MTNFHQIADRLGIKYPGLSFSIETFYGEPIEYLSADFRLNDEARLSFEVGLTLSARPEEPKWYSRIELASAYDEHVFLSQGEGQTATKNLQKPGRRKSRCCFLAHPMRQRLPEKRTTVRQG
jgi:hypothetical protein